MEVTYREEELPSVAKSLIEAFDEIPVWLFHGEMGAGKTTLIKAVSDALGVQDDMSSPTFAIVNEYQGTGDNEIYHFDFYRVEEIKEAINIGAEDYFYSGNRCFIEWPEVIVELLPANYVEISIKLVDSKTRHLTTRLNGSTS